MLRSVAAALGTLGVLRAVEPAACTHRHALHRMDAYDQADCVEELPAWREVDVGALRLAHRGTQPGPAPSSRCSVPDDSRHRLALHLAAALGGVADWRGDRLFWLGVEVGAPRPCAPPWCGWVQPTECFLWAHRVHAWAVFLCLLDMLLTSGRSPIPAFALAWAGPALLCWAALWLLVLCPRRRRRGGSTPGAA